MEKVERFYFDVLHYLQFRLRTNQQNVANQKWTIAPKQKKIINGKRRFCMQFDFNDFLSDFNDWQYTSACGSVDFFLFDKVRIVETDRVIFEMGGSLSRSTTCIQ